MGQIIPAVVHGEDNAPYFQIVIEAFPDKINGSLQIIDISVPASAYITNSIAVGGETISIDASNGYVYVVDKPGMFHIIDAFPVDEAYVMNSIDTPGYAKDIEVIDNLAFIADGIAGLRIYKLW